MTFKKYTDDPKVGTRSYRGINLTVNQLFITSEMSRQYIKSYQFALVEYDKEKTAIRLTLTNTEKNNTWRIRTGVSYAHYIPCRLALIHSMPTGRYYLENTKKANGDTTLIFTHTTKK